jgi:lycopene beta-cyclase
LNPITSYDYIICGAGCAGLSLVMHIIASEELRNKKILIVDQDAKTKNDRTWCFWEKGKGLFEPIVYKEWKELFFYSDSFTKTLDIAPYTYKLIRGIDFYHYCFDQIKGHSNITYKQATIDKIFSDDKNTGIVIDGETIYSAFVFNSVLFNKPELTAKECWLLQHFKGWVIETEKPAFDEQVGTLMDFRTSQDEGATFFYVLPFSSTQALVEYTLFSPKILLDESYDNALQQYITGQLNLDAFTIREREFGIIPMTNYRFATRRNNILNIGTAGGQTKASSGYTFQYIQKHSAAIVESLIKYSSPFHLKGDSRRFQFYDSVLLYILNKRTLQGADIFTQLFKKNKASNVFSFLDNETSLADELRIISTLPTLPFTRAAIQQLSF